MPRVTLDDPDGTLSLLRDSVAQFAAQHDGGRVFRDKRERGADLDKTVWTAMAQAGWTGLMLPEPLGGSGLGMREQAILSEALGRALIAEPVASASVLSGVLIADAPGFRRAPAIGRRHRRRTADCHAGLAGLGRSVEHRAGRPRRARQAGLC